MELKKWPETEMEYWATIESLGALIFWTSHDLADGRMEDPEGKADGEITSAQSISEKLVGEVCEKFGVIHPKDTPTVSLGEELPPPPEGKSYYWSWYKRMKGKYYQAEYEKIICSACPFSNGLDDMISRNGGVPCGLFQGVMNSLSTPHLCGVVYPFQDMTQEQLYKEIRQKAGKEALTAFKEKEKALAPTLQPTS